MNGNELALGSIVISFVLGACIGSFLNVIIYRSLHEMSPFKGRSICDKCRRQLRWYENVPIVSFVVLRGKCRSCKQKIDWSYPVVELITGLLFVWWVSLGWVFFKLSSFPLLVLQPLFWLSVGLVLVVIFFADLLYYIIPDSAVVVLAGLTILYRIFLISTGVMQVKDFIVAVAAGLIASAFFGGLYWLTKGKGLGFGDVKLALVMGFLLGFPKAVVGFFLSFVFGGIIGTGLLVVGCKKFGQVVPFGPFLILGLLVSLVWGDELWSWYMGLLRI